MPMLILRGYDSFDMEWFTLTFRTTNLDAAVIRARKEVAGGLDEVNIVEEESGRVLRNIRKESENAEINYTNDEDFKHFNFCPLCGQPLKQTKLDRVVLKAAGLDPESQLFPTQSFWDAASVLSQAKRSRGRDCLSLDTVEDSPVPIFELGICGLWWPGSPSEARETTLAKALLWAVTELTVEDIEKLFETKS